MRQVPLECDINIAVNGCFGFTTSSQERAIMAMLISRSRGTCLIRQFFTQNCVNDLVVCYIIVNDIIVCYRIVSHDLLHLDHLLVGDQLDDLVDGHGLVLLQTYHPKREYLMTYFITNSISNLFSMVQNSIGDYGPLPLTATLPAESVLLEARLRKERPGDLGRSCCCQRLSLSVEKDEHFID